MGLSILVAKIIALVYIAASIAVLSGKITFAKMIEDFEKSPALTYVTGLFTLIIGALLVNYHNIWVKDWTVLITLIGWIGLVKGFLIIAFPGFMSAFKWCYKNTRAWGVLMLLLGLVFGYLGFLA